MKLYQPFSGPVRAAKHAAEWVEKLSEQETDSE
jgi:hypothetical protein